MTQEDNSSTKEALAAMLTPIARLMIDSGIPLPEGVELLKVALLTSASDQFPEASASHLSLVTGVHRKDVKRLVHEEPQPKRSATAARVLALWQNEPDFSHDGEPRTLNRNGADGFDALVARAKVDAAPATVLSILLDSGNVIEQNGDIKFVSANVVPEDREEKLKVAVATLKPHLETTVDNVLGRRSQWDQALRYSHLSEDAARKLENQASELFLELLQELGRKANALQQETEGNTLFVAGTYTNVTEQDH